MEGNSMDTKDTRHRVYEALAAESKSTEPASNVFGYKDELTQEELTRIDEIVYAYSAIQLLIMESWKTPEAIVGALETVFEGETLQAVAHLLLERRHS
jgi:hypothetical protein